jgi:hypothetical protein
LIPLKMTYIQLHFIYLFKLYYFKMKSILPQWARPPFLCTNKSIQPTGAVFASVIHDLHFTYLSKLGSHCFARWSLAIQHLCHSITWVDGTCSLHCIPTHHEALVGQGIFIDKTLNGEGNIHPNEGRIQAFAGLTS